MFGNRSTAYYACYTTSSLSVEPAYKSTDLITCIEPSLNSHAVSALTTPFASHAPTPRSEHISAKRILPFRILPPFFSNLLSNQSKIFSARKSSPSYSLRTVTALRKKAATYAGVNVLNLLDEVQRLLPPIFENIIDSQSFYRHLSQTCRT